MRKNRWVCALMAALMMILPVGPGEALAGEEGTPLAEGETVTTAEESLPEGEETPLAEEPLPAMVEPLPAEGSAPYPPVESALSADGMGYDDGTLKVKIETEIVQETKVYWVSVEITDPSQLRTATAGARGSKVLAQPTAIAKRDNAVLAINGDWFASHNSGVVFRHGKQWRNVPVYSRDTLIVDENGDLHILAFGKSTPKARMQEALESFQQAHQIREAFAFGPGLIIDGVKQEINYREKVSCDALNKAQRTVFCQTGPMQYLFLVTEGPEQFEPGFTVPECADLIAARGGVLQAYNLDGGNSSQIVLCGQKVNAAEYEKARNIADMICFATMAAPQE